MFGVKVFFKKLLKSTILFDKKIDMERTPYWAVIQEKEALLKKTNLSSKRNWPLEKQAKEQTREVTNPKH